MRCVHVVRACVCIQTCAIHYLCGGATAITRRQRRRRRQSVDHVMYIVRNNTIWCADNSAMSYLLGVFDPAHTHDTAPQRARVVVVHDEEGYTRLCCLRTCAMVGKLDRAASQYSTRTYDSAVRANRPTAIITVLIYIFFVVCGVLCAELCNRQIMQRNIFQPRDRARRKISITRRRSVVRGASMARH